MAGRTIYVSPTGNNSNPGTAALPFLTITAALAVTPALGANDTIIVKAGTYNEQVVVNRGGDATGNFTLKSEVAKAAKIRAPSNVYSAVNIIKSYVTFDGFDVQTYGTGHGIEATFIDGNSSNPGPHHINIINCASHDNAGGGIEVAYGDFYLIDNNICWGNCATNQYQGSGISVYEPRAVAGSGTLRIIISRNICYLNQAFNLVGGGTHSDANGIICDDFQNTQNPGAWGSYAYQTLVENNLCYFNGGKGIHVFFSDNVLVRNNTCYYNNRDNANPATWRGELNNQCGNNCTWVNNIAVADPQVNTYNTAILNGATSGQTNAGTVFKRNLTFNGTPGASSVAQPQSNATLTTSAPYNNIFGVDPLFILPGSDFRLQSSSPAKDVGVTDYGVGTVDLLGNPRVADTAVDLGAYEVVAVVVTPIPPGTPSTPSNQPSTGALATYSDLVAAVGDWLNRADLVAQIPYFITMAEARFNRVIRHNSMIQRDTTTATTDYVALPDDWLEQISVVVTNNPAAYKPPEYVSNEEYNRLRLQELTGPVRYYTIQDDNIALLPTFSSGNVALEVFYYGKIPALSASNPTNWLLARAPDLYLYASLVAAEAYLQNDERLPVWSSAVETILGELAAESERAKRPQGALTARVRTFG